MSILSLLAATTGLMPTAAWWQRLAGTVAHERYPCEGGRCACPSAKQCWTTCRCHTLAQKVEWARRNHVEIPSYVDLSRLDLAKAPPAKPACPLCVSHDDNTGTEPDQPSARPDAGPRLPSLTPLGCRGIDLLMAFGALVGVSPQRTLVTIDEPARHAPRRVIADAFAHSRTLDIEPPPPRPIRLG